MGSLPNLSEICKEEDIPIYFKPGLALGRVQPQSFRNERTKIRYRQSERGEMPKTKRKMYPPTVTTTTKWMPFDDLILQNSTCSPLSSRSAHLAHNIKRKDSLTSSIGATSVRRLISVVRNSHNRPSRHYSKRVIIRYLIIFCLCHLFINATFLPFLVLQGSVSIWTTSISTSLPVSINVGSYLLALMYFLAALSTLFSPYIVHRLEAKFVLMLSYGTFSLFYAAHLYPNPYLLIPVYALLGLVIGQFSLSYVSFLMEMSTKMSCAMSEDEELKLARRTVIIRRFARSIQASQDLGLIFGSLVVAILIAFLQEPAVDPLLQTGCNWSQENLNCTNCAQIDTCTACSFSNLSNGALTKNCTHLEILQLSATDYNAFANSIFDADEHGHRICGAPACASAFTLISNNSNAENFTILPKKTSVLMIIIFISLSLLSTIISSVGLKTLKTCTYQDALENLKFFTSMKTVQNSFRNVKLQLVAPLAFFIGMEQAFIYSDFSKSYVVCTLGIQHLNLVFLSMGVLQSIAACTLSMLLKSIQRYYVVGVGFTFQCCVLMVQILWKPINDDPALFYVIPAVWGVCNAIWEILTFSLLTTQFTENWSAPFCNFTFFRFLGLSISFLFHGFLCNWIKLYILAILLLLAVIPTLWLEISLAKSQKKIATNRL